MADDPQVVVDLVNVRELVERSDVDPNQRIPEEALGTEDWGDGFRVTPELVFIERGVQGEIVRTTPLAEVLDQRSDSNPVIAPTLTNPTPLGLEDREKMVRIMAVRLFKWYAAQPPSARVYNPIYDGIPNLPPGAAENLQPLPGTKLYPATAGEVLEWIKTVVIGPRVDIINRKLGKDGYISELRLTRNPDTLS